jgi:N,N'-diacetyllegionaminate synthase
MKKKKIIVIAEAGVNHNGSIKLAKKLIDVAVNSGADFVKFQHTNPENASSKAPLVNYQKKKSLKNQKNMIKNFHINWKRYYPVLINYCKKKKIKFLQSFFSALDYEESRKFNFNYIKIPSSDIVNTPLLKLIGKDNKKIFLSTGMSNAQEVSDAINILVESGMDKKNITLFYCVSAYPTQIKNINLNSILFLKKKFKTQVGFSDHTKGSFASALAVTMGCRIFEKHFTLNKKLIGPDHKLSLEPEELKDFIFNLKNYHSAFGKYEKKCLRIEKQAREVTRQSVHAKKKIKKGDLFNENNIMLKRPGNGIPPSMFETLMGRKAKKNYRIDDQIKN